MSEEQVIQEEIQIKTALLFFLKDVSVPLVLYFDNPVPIYEELLELIKTKEEKMVEFDPNGPVIRAAIPSTHIVGVALQQEQYVIR